MLDDTRFENIINISKIGIRRKNLNDLLIGKKQLSLVSNYLLHKNKLKPIYR